MLKKIHRYSHRCYRVLDRLFCPSSYSFAAIIMLHRIGKPNPMRLEMNEHLKIDPIDLERFIIQAKDYGYKFVSIDELSDRINNRRCHRKLIAITLDDGYIDNLELGLPLFEKHNVPFCIYVATGFVEKELIYWWNILEDLIQSNETLILGNGESYDCSTKLAKEQSFLAIREWILKQPQGNLRDTLSTLFKGYDVDLGKYKDTEALTWEQIKTLLKNPLCTIGCHTHSHKSFTGCSDKEIVEDIQKAESLFEKRIGQKPRHFAFPYGDDCAVNTHHEELLHDLGYVTVATTHESFIDVHTDPLRLPRIFMDSKIWKYILSEIKREL